MGDQVVVQIELGISASKKNAVSAHDGHVRAGQFSTDVRRGFHAVLADIHDRSIIDYSDHNAGTGGHTDPVPSDVFDRGAIDHLQGSVRGLVDVDAIAVCAVTVKP